MDLKCNKKEGGGCAAAGSIFVDAEHRDTKRM